MKFWWFKFEGWSSDDAPEHPGEGVFSECLVQGQTYLDAEFDFLSALSVRGINLIEIEDHFSIDTDPEELDYENPDNKYWIEWCDETAVAHGPTFEIMHFYPAREVDRNLSREAKH